MFDHILLKVKDLKASKRFYTAALAPLGFQVEYEGKGIVAFGPKGAPALCAGRGRAQRTGACRIRRQDSRRGEGRISILRRFPPAARTTASPACGPSIPRTTTADS